MFFAEFEDQPPEVLGVPLVKEAFRQVVVFAGQQAAHLHHEELRPPVGPLVYVAHGHYAAVALIHEAVSRVRYFIAQGFQQAVVPLVGGEDLVFGPAVVGPLVVGFIIVVVFAQSVEGLAVAFPGLLIVARAEGYGLLEVVVEVVGGEIFAYVFEVG